MKRVFETAECEAVRNSIFWELRYEKRENNLFDVCGVCGITETNNRQADSGKKP